MASKGLKHKELKHKHSSSYQRYGIPSFLLQFLSLKEVTFCALVCCLWYQKCKQDWKKMLQVLDMSHVAPYVFCSDKSFVQFNDQILAANSTCKHLILAECQLHQILTHHTSGIVFPFITKITVNKYRYKAGNGGLADGRLQKLFPSLITFGVWNMRPNYFGQLLED